MANITWYVNNSGVFAEKEEHDLGTFKKNETIEVEMQVWNNRWGVNNTSSIDTPILEFGFQDFEDSSLIDACTVRVDNVQMAITNKDSKGIVLIGRSLSGKSNDGSTTDSTNQLNYATIKLSIDTTGKSLKQNDLKKLLLEIKELD